MRLEIADAVGRDVGGHQRVADDLALAVDARRREAGAARAVVVDARSADDREDRVAIGAGVLETLERHYADAVAEHRAGGGGVERPAMPIGGENAVFLVPVAGVLRQPQRRGAGQRQIALSVQQRLTGEVHGHERGRAGGLHREARPFQVQLVRDARRHVGQLGAHGDRQRVGVRQQIEMRVEVCLVRAERRAAVHADRPAEHARIVAGAFERLPTALHEEPLLRIHQQRLAATEAEERRVEHLDALDDTARLDVGTLLQHRRIEIGRVDVLIGELRDRLGAVTDVAPERLQVSRAGKPSHHSDDGDAAELVAIVAHVLETSFTAPRRRASCSRCRRIRSRRRSSESCSSSAVGAAGSAGLAAAPIDRTVSPS